MLTTQATLKVRHRAGTFSKEFHGAQIPWLEHRRACSSVMQRVGQQHCRRASYALMDDSLYDLPMQRLTWSSSTPSLASPTVCGSTATTGTSQPVAITRSTVTQTASPCLLLGNLLQQGLVLVSSQRLPSTPVSFAGCCDGLHRGLSRGERLMPPAAYMQLLNLSDAANSSNTWLTYTINWQPSHVSWAINGVPVLRRTTGEVERWADMEGRPFE